MDEIEVDLLGHSRLNASVYLSLRFTTISNMNGIAGKLGSFNLLYSALILRRQILYYKIKKLRIDVPYSSWLSATIWNESMSHEMTFFLEPSCHPDDSTLAADQSDRRLQHLLYVWS